MNKMYKKIKKDKLWKDKISQKIYTMYIMWLNKLLKNKKTK